MFFMFHYFTGSSSRTVTFYLKYGSQQNNLKHNLNMYVTEVSVLSGVLKTFLTIMYNNV
jgi:hypothetical protein